MLISDVHCPGTTWGQIRVRSRGQTALRRIRLGADRYLVSKSPASVESAWGLIDTGWTWWSAGCRSPPIGCISRFSTTNPRVVIVSLDHRPAGEERVALDDIADEPLPPAA
jgi:hypothetical protein